MRELERVFREVRGLPENQGELQQFAFREALKLLRAARVFDPEVLMQQTSTRSRITLQVVEDFPDTQQETEPFSLTEQLRNPTITLFNGRQVRNIPANLGINFGTAARAWRQYRKLRLDDLVASSGIGKSRLSDIENGHRTKESVLIAISRGLEVPLGVLVTRLKPTNIFADGNTEESASFPNIDVHFERTYGDVLLAWREFLGIKQTDMARIIGANKSWLSSLEHNKIKSPLQLDELIVRLMKSLNIPAGIILTRSLPEEVVL